MTGTEEEWLEFRVTNPEYDSMTYEEYCMLYLEAESDIMTIAMARTEVLSKLLNFKHLDKDAQVFLTQKVTIEHWSNLSPLTTVVASFNETDGFKDALFQQPEALNFLDYPTYAKVMLVDPTTSRIDLLEMMDKAYMDILNTPCENFDSMLSYLQIKNIKKSKPIPDVKSFH